MNEDVTTSDEDSPVPLDLVERALATRQLDQSQASSVGPWPYLEKPGAVSSLHATDAEQPRIDTIESTVT